ncbi:Serine/threonine-protein kinase PknD [Planctomycetales bacterium 10988]|nr:Serine/threonine-protein kinase PknD [Planctomycetales bacterium 10988]
MSSPSISQTSPHSSASLSRRSWLQGLVVGGMATTIGCLAEPGSENSLGSLDKVWGRQGVSEGRFQKPRALTIDQQGDIYVVDMTSRIQKFDSEGNFLLGWKTPIDNQGRPTGLAVDRSGRLLVADTHYYRILIYTPDGELVQVFGGQRGSKLGEFGLVTDAIQHVDGHYYVSEYGDWDRIQLVNADGSFVKQWGGHGTEPGKFLRPQNLRLDPQDRIWVADACNHRLQVFSSEGELITFWGTPGSRPGELSYPYDLEFDEAGHVYVCEYGNHRIQKFTAEGESLGCWGTAGRKPGQLWNPWGIIRDLEGRLHVLDTNNHRIQRIWM